MPCGNSSHPVNVTGTCDGPHSEKNTLAVSWGRIGDDYEYELMFTFVKVKKIAIFLYYDSQKCSFLCRAKKNGVLVKSLPLLT